MVVSYFECVKEEKRSGGREVTSELTTCGRAQWLPGWDGSGLE